MKKPERYFYPAVFTYEDNQEILLVIAHVKNSAPALVK